MLCAGLRDTRSPRPAATASSWPQHRHGHVPTCSLLLPRVLQPSAFHTLLHTRVHLIVLIIQHTPVLRFALVQGSWQGLAGRESRTRQEEAGPGRSKQDQEGPGRTRTDQAGRSRLEQAGVSRTRQAGQVLRYFLAGGQHSPSTAFPLHFLGCAHSTGGVGLRQC